MERRFFVIVLSLLTFAVVFCLQLVEGEGSFKTYNNEERERFMKLKNRSFNEVDFDHLHEHNKIPDVNVRNVRPSGNNGIQDVQPKFDPTWTSLDARPLPAWYDQSKIGIFIHWGVFSVPGVESEWFWKTWTDGREECVNFMNDNYKPGFKYQEFAPEFTAEFYNATEWADIFSRSGAKYVVLTSKHHEGYTLWPSKYAFSWNAMDIGPHRDVLGELATAIRSDTTLRFGLYHSLYEWYNPLWISDNKNNQTTDEFVRLKTLPELYEIVNTYKPEIVWSDGEWEAPDTYWKSLEFIAWLYNDSPVKDTVVTNDRWGHNTLCTHGGYYTCADRYNPGVLQPHKWENCLTIDKESWGFRRNTKIEDYLTPEELITTIVETVSCGGNVLVNVGPTREGMIPPIQQERLLQMGEWLEINGDAIYNAVPWTYQNDTVTPGVWFTSNPSGSIVYAMITNWPGSTVQLGVVTQSTGMTVSLLGTEGVLQFNSASPGIRVTLPHPDTIKSQWAWTLVISK